MAYDALKGYDPSVDYSDQLKRTDLSASERSRLEQERQNKINDKYKGVEPTMNNSTQKFSEVYTSSAKSSTRDDSTYSGSPGYTVTAANSGKASASNPYGLTVGSTSGSFNPATSTNKNTLGYTTSGAVIDPNKTNYGSSVYSVPDIGTVKKTAANPFGVNEGRREDLAGGIAKSGGYTVFYDDLGYVTQVVKGTVDYAPHLDYYAATGQYNNLGAWTDQEAMGDKSDDYKTIKEIRARIGQNGYTAAQANADANAIRAKYGYSIDSQGYVTDFGALTRVNDRRQQYGLSTNPESDGAQYYRYLWNTDTGKYATDNGLVDDYGAFLAKNGSGGQQAVGTPVMPAGYPQSSGSSAASGTGYGSGGYGYTPQETGYGGFSFDDSAAEYLRQMYADSLNSQLAGLQAAYQQNVANYRAQDDLINDYYYGQRNQAAAQNELQRMQMNEFGLANGLNTGTAGQLALANGAALQGSLAALGSAEAQDRAANQLAIANLGSQYNADIASATANINSQMNSALYNEYARQQELAYNAWQAELARQQQMALQAQKAALARQQWEAEYDLKLRQYQAQQEADARKQAYNLASTMLGLGLTPTEEVLEAAGISAADAGTYAAAIRAQALNRSTRSGASSGSGSKGSTAAAAGQTESTWVYLPGYGQTGGGLRYL